MESGFKSTRFMVKLSKTEKWYSEMEGFNLASIIYLCLVIVLIVIFVVSFTLFIRRLIINSAAKSNQTVEIEKKLDKIIDLHEREKNPN